MATTTMDPRKALISARNILLDRVEEIQRKNEANKVGDNGRLCTYGQLRMAAQKIVADMPPGCQESIARELGVRLISREKRKDTRSLSGWLRLIAYELADSFERIHPLKISRERQ